MAVPGNSVPTPPTIRFASGEDIAFEFKFVDADDVATPHSGVLSAFTLTIRKLADGDDASAVYSKTDADAEITMETTSRTVTWEDSAFTLGGAGAYKYRIDVTLNDTNKRTRWGRIMEV